MIYTLTMSGKSSQNHLQKIIWKFRMKVTSKMLKHHEGCCMGNNKPLLINQKDRLTDWPEVCRLSHTLLRPIETAIIKEGEKKSLHVAPLQKHDCVYNQSRFPRICAAAVPLDIQRNPDSKSQRRGSGMRKFSFILENEKIYLKQWPFWDF